MNKTIERELTISEEYIHIRLDQALSQLWPEFSRSTIKSWIEKGDLKLDNAIVKPKTKLHGGEHITLNTSLEEQVEWQAEDIPLDIIYEDDDVLVINKPTNLVVHPGAGNHSGTLVNALLHHCPSLSQLPRAGIVHRLDKDTTGLLVVAKTLESHHSLVQQLQARSVKREYLALVYGTLISGKTIDLPIDRHPTQRLKMAIVDEGKEAITHIRIEEKLPHLTLLRVNLETGRTHQIRVHLSHIKHPIVGDQTYGRLYLPKGSSEPVKEALKNFRRQALHAFKLSFKHPKTEELVSFEAPIPEDFEALIKVLKENP